MSFTIFYDKQFIKAKRNNEEVFVPMIYGGSSNCFEVGKNGRSERRERDWFALKFILNGKIAGTLEEMLEKAEAEKAKLIERNKDDESKYSDDRFGWFSSLSFGGGCKVTFGQYKGLFITGCKKALTVEELKEFGVGVYISTYLYEDEKKIALKQAGKELKYVTINTSDELLTKFDELEKYYEGTGVSVFLKIDAFEHQMKRIRKAKFPTTKKVKQFVDVDKYFVMYIAGCGYFYSATRNGFRYTPYQNSGKQFLTEKDANTYMKKFNKRHVGRTTVIEPVNEKARVLTLV